VELDGVWRVERVAGALPPLTGVRKRIRGARGETRLGPAAVGFDVVGSQLRYRAPLTGLVDVLTPDGDGFAGRTLLYGRHVGRFRMTRERTEMATIESELVRHLDEAYAMEQSVLRMLDGMIQTTLDADVVRELEHHRTQTEGHAERMKERLAAHGVQPSMLRELGGVLGAVMKMPLDVMRAEKAGRSARDLYTTEHMEIAAYELLARIADRAGDAETAAAARDVLADEREMAQAIEAHWDRFAALALDEAGVAAAAP
jgi:ferritin-like metal-binding protein YciE